MKLSFYIEWFTVTLSVCPTFVMSILNLSHTAIGSPWCYFLFFFPSCFWLKIHLVWGRGGLCGGLFAFARAVAYGTKNPPGLKEEKVLAFSGYVVILEQTGVSDWKGSTEDYIKAHSAKMSSLEVLLSPQLSAVETVSLLSCWICRF